MIIKREYVPFKFLLSRDPKAEKLFMTVFEKSYQGMDNEQRARCFDSLIQLSLSQRELGWCMTEIGDLISGFEKLDIEKPYDNGLTYNDVDRIDIIDKDESGVTVQLVSQFDGNEQIISIERIERD